MDTRAGKRKAEQASDLPADGGAADSGSKIFDLAAYRVAVENANAYAADALKNMKDFHCAMEEAVRYTLGMDAQARGFLFIMHVSVVILCYLTRVSRSFVLQSSFSAIFL